VASSRYRCEGLFAGELSHRLADSAVAEGANDRIVRWNGVSLNLKMYAMVTRRHLNNGPTLFRRVQF
jgi:hypothetical protein